MVAEYDSAARMDSVMTDREQVVAMIGWKAPKAEFVKLNTDGACKSASTAGCGGVIRGCQGEWIRGFAKNVGLCNAFVAEMWGVMEGLRCARSMGFKKVELCIDSSSVVQVLKSRKFNSLAGVTIVHQISIWQLLDLDWETEISHSYREANKCADVLANVGCSLGHDIVFYDGWPSFLNCMLMEDTMRITTPRLISV